MPTQKYNKFIDHDENTNIKKSSHWYKSKIADLYVYQIDYMLAPDIYWTELVYMSEEMYIF